MKHTPVLLQQVINGLNIQKGKKYIDATYGLGGHSTEILKKGGIVLGIDWDDNQCKMQSEKFKIDNFKLICGNYANIEKIAKENGFFPADGILFDLGLSMFQIEKSKKGFSYQNLEEPLDMRISNQLRVKAKDIINKYKKEELYDLFTKNAETINIWPVINAIITRRRLKKIVFVKDIIKILNYKIKDSFKREKIKKQIFQALRIEVNQENQNIKEGLIGAVKTLANYGRLVVITFHPSEDRLIKKEVKKLPIVAMTKKAIQSKSNKSFERSARLRIYQKS